MAWVKVDDTPKKRNWVPVTMATGSFSAGLRLPEQEPEPANLFMKGLQGFNKSIEGIQNAPPLSPEAEKGQQLLGRDAALLGFGNEAEAGV